MSLTGVFTGGVDLVEAYEQVSQYDGTNVLIKYMPFLSVLFKVVMAMFGYMTDLDTVDELTSEDITAQGSVLSAGCLSTHLLYIYCVQVMTWSHCSFTFLMNFYLHFLLIRFLSQRYGESVMLI